MATNKSVVILTPNGRRQNVKVTPNTTILQVLEEVCKKQGFKAEEYDLKHHNHVLDTTAIIRFSGLPNNAQLEMCAIQKVRTETTVLLGIQLESGTRLMGQFSPGDNLLQVVRKLCPDETTTEQNLVLIYMRKELYGDALENTTLRSLGLTGGRAMIRLIHRSPEELKTQANVSAPLPSKPSEEKPYVRKIKEPSPTHSPEHCAASLNQSQPQTPEEKPKSPTPEEKFKRHSPEKLNPNFAADFLKKEKSKKNEIMKKKTSQSEPMEIDEVPQNENVFCEKKGKGKSKVKFAEEIKTEELVFLGDRNAMAFSLEMANTVPHEDLPDEFFELTIQDVRKLFNDLKQKRLELEENPLQTTAMRNLEQSKRVLRHIHQYKKSIIRIQFPDRTVLQGTFKPLETIQNVLNFVKGFLQIPTIDFHLYTTPPKNILNPDHTLADAQCVPCALIHFGTYDSLPENHRFLREDIVSKFVTPSTASIAASSLITKERRALQTEDIQMNYGLDDDVNVGASTSKDPPEVPKDEPKSKVPKWFKTNK